MNVLSIITEIGSDAELLCRSDEWLENERRFIATKMSNLAQELGTILKAQRLKTKLQQQNLVAIQETQQDNDGQINDIAIKIQPLPVALKTLENQPDTIISKANNIAQLFGWQSDGYDINTSRELHRDSA